MPTINLNVILAAVFGLFVLYFVGKMLVTPVRFAIRVMLSRIMGAGLILIFNLAGSLFGAIIGVNAFTVLVVGYLGLPGLAMLVLLQQMLA
ncbi:MAG: pro-sigmaK processing inhibitor BofA family protein [Dethiobacter sp.]